MCTKHLVSILSTSTCKHNTEPGLSHEHQYMQTQETKKLLLIHSIMLSIKTQLQTQLQQGQEMQHQTQARKVAPDCA